MYWPVKAAPASCLPIWQRVQDEIIKALEGKVTPFFGKLCRIACSKPLFFNERTEQEKHLRTITDIAP